MTQGTSDSDAALDAISSFDYASFRDKDLVNNYRELRPNFFTSPPWEEWFEREDNDWILYCSGEPRCGKTTFAGAIARHIRDHEDTSSTTPVISIFLGLRDVNGCTAWETSRRVAASTSRVVLRSILRQLLESQHAPSKLQTIKGSVVDSWRNIELKSHVCQALSNLDSAFIIFDALDECPESVQTELLDLMAELRLYAKIACTGLPLDQLRSQRISCSADSCSQPGVGLLSWWYCPECEWYTCWPCHKLDRRCLDATHEMRAPPFYVQTSLAVDGDIIQDFLSDALAHHQQLDPTVLESLIVKILGMCGGSFSLASLILNNINGKNLDEVLEVSDRLPNYQIRNFNFFFAELEYQQPSNARLAKEAITLVAGTLDRETAFQPLNLDQLVSALDFMNSESRVFETAVTRPRVLQATKGFLTMDGKGDIDFAHSSLQEYVSNEWLTRQDSALALRNLCIQALGREKVLSQVGEHPRQLLRYPDSMLPFLQYTLSNLGACLDPRLSGSLQATTDFLETHFHANQELGLAQLALDRRSWAGTDKLHILPHFDSTDVLQHYIDESPQSLNVRDHLTGDTLAMLACEQCNLDLVKLLLDAGDKVDFSMKCYKDNTAFWRAVKNGSGQTELLQRLLKDLNREALNAPCEKGKTALMLAIEEETLDEETFALLASHHDIELGVRDSQGRTAAHIAAAALDTNTTYLRSMAEHPHFHKVCHLQDHSGRNAFMLVAGSNAPQEERLKMIDLLLDKGAEVSSTDNYGRTVLHYAAATKYSRRVIRHLLAHKATMAQMQDKRGRTALNVAIDSGISHESMQALAEHAAQKPSVPQWKKDLVELLQDPEFEPGKIKDMDVTKADSSQNTLLHIAVEYANDVSVIQLLLGNPRVEYRAENADGSTALHLALRRLQRTLHMSLRGETDDDDEAGEKDVEVKLPPAKLLSEIICVLLDDKRAKDMINVLDHAGKAPIDLARLIANSSQAFTERKKARKPSALTNVLFKVISLDADMGHLSHRHVQTMFEWAIRQASLTGNTWPKVVQSLVDAGADVLLRIKELNYKLPWQAIPVSRSSDHREISDILERQEKKVFEQMRGAHKSTAETQPSTTVPLGKHNVN